MIDPVYLDMRSQGLATTSNLRKSIRQLAKSPDSVGTVSFKPVGLLTSSATGGGVTRSMAFSSTVPFSAVEIGYVHVGGTGAATGILACVAATDDPGALNYSLGNTVPNKKFIVPILAGVEHNTVEAYGWKSVTWGGLTTTTALDAGAQKISIAMSDVIPCQSIPQNNGSGLYWGLIRWFEAIGPRTTGGYSGIATGTQYNSSAGFAKIFFSTGNSGDCVTVPSILTTANTQSFSSSPAPNLFIRLHSLTSSRPKTILMCGDSRFDTVTESPQATTTAYDSFSFKLANTLVSSGTNVHLIRGASGGYPSVSYQQHGMKLLDYSYPDVGVYLIYSVNDGTMTQALVNDAKYRAIAFVEKCIAKGVAPYLVTSYPRGGMTTYENSLLVELDTWARGSEVPYFSPLSVYGNSDGTWKTGVSTDGTNHMTQASYQDMANKVATDLLSKLIV